jgi:predicted component of type VI protein secretion system
MAHLVITSGQLEGRRIDVARELVIGRENVDVEIDDAELSRRHFAVRPVAGGLEVEDLGSRNGTRVDGTRIAGPTRVRHGSVVTVGMTTLAVEVPQEAPAGGAGETRAHVSQGTVVGQAPARPPRRPPAPPAPAPGSPAAPVTASARAGATTQPFGRYQASSSQRRRKAATRLWVPQVLTYASVLGTAAGLIIYFADH